MLRVIARTFGRRRPASKVLDLDATGDRGERAHQLLHRDDRFSCRSFIVLLERAFPVALHHVRASERALTRRACTPGPWRCPVLRVPLRSPSASFLLHPVRHREEIRSQVPTEFQPSVHAVAGMDPVEGLAALLEFARSAARGVFPSPGSPSAAPPPRTPAPRAPARRIPPAAPACRARSSGTGMKNRRRPARHRLMTSSAFAFPSS